MIKSFNHRICKLTTARRGTARRGTARRYPPSLPARASPSPSGPGRGRAARICKTAPGDGDRRGKSFITVPEASRRRRLRRRRRPRGPTPNRVALIQSHIHQIKAPHSAPPSPSPRCLPPALLDNDMMRPFEGDGRPGPPARARQIERGAKKWRKIRPKVVASRRRGGRRGGGLQRPSRARRGRLRTFGPAADLLRKWEENPGVVVVFSSTLNY